RVGELRPRAAPGVRADADRLLPGDRHAAQHDLQLQGSGAGAIVSGPVRVQRVRRGGGQADRCGGDRPPAAGDAGARLRPLRRADGFRRPPRAVSVLLERRVSPDVVPEAVRSLLEAGTDAAVVLDPDRRILYYNRAYQLASGTRGRALQEAAEQ